MDISPETGGDWWFTDIVVPSDAYRMNFVFTDGENTYDNNHGQDFARDVSGGPTEDEWRTVIKPRRLAIAAEAKRVADEFEQAKTEVMELRESSANGHVSVESTVSRDGKAVMYSVPEKLTAGERGTIFFNSAATAFRSSGE